MVFLFLYMQIGGGIDFFTLSLLDSKLDNIITVEASHCVEEFFLERLRDRGLLT